MADYLGSGGRLKLYALTDDREKANDWDTPGVCPVCGAMVPGYNVTLMSEDGFEKPAEIHKAYHEARGEL